MERVNGCACGSVESCHICHLCMERHCRCQSVDRDDKDVASEMCRESRACDCFVSSSKHRCPLCRGCRQPSKAVYSHCRCVYHQKELEGRNVEEDDVDARCSCFRFAREKQKALVKKAEKDARAERIAQIRQSGGFPTISSIYDRKVGQAEDELAEDPIIPYEFQKGLSHRITNVPVVGPRGISMMESIEAKERYNKPSTTLISTPPKEAKWLERAFDNIVYERGRDSALPLDSVVDYVVHIASLQISEVEELVGSLDESAAIALAVIVEEYMNQLVQDSVVGDERHLVRGKRACVEQYVTLLLRGFDWQVFMEECQSLLPSTHVISDDYVVSRLTTIVHRKLLEIPTVSSRMHRKSWVKDAIKSQVTKLHEVYKSHQRMIERKDETVPSKRLMRVSVRKHKKTGTPLYRFEYHGKVSRDRSVVIKMDGLASREAAFCKISEVEKALVPLQTHRMLLEKDPRVEAFFDSIKRQLEESRETTSLQKKRKLAIREYRAQQKAIRTARKKRTREVRKYEQFLMSERLRKEREREEWLAQREYAKRRRLNPSRGLSANDLQDLPVLDEMYSEVQRVINKNMSNRQSTGADQVEINDAEVDT